MSVADTQRDPMADLRTAESADGLRLLRGICHDVGQELAVVQALARLAALEVGVPDVVRLRLATIGEHAAYVARMLSDSVEGITVTTEFDLGDLVRRMVADVGLRTQTTCEMVASSVRVTANPILLRRAVVNLLDNAVRAAGPDGLVLTRVVRDGDKAVIEVEDDGPGWGHVQPGSASLGLGVAHNCVALHGGELELEAGRLGGALVRIRLAAGTR